MKHRVVIGLAVASIFATSVCAQAADTAPTAAVAPDNTKVNRSDKRDATRSAQTQSNATGDVELLAAVRKRLVEDDGLSTYAHNVKIVATNGKVTLRGPVRSSQERDMVVAHARSVDGVTSVDNRLTVAPAK